MAPTHRASHTLTTAIQRTVARYANPRPRNRSTQSQHPIQKPDLVRLEVTGALSA